jgi:hypothetical protein
MCIREVAAGKKGDGRLMKARFGYEKCEAAAKGYQTLNRAAGE